MARLQALDSRYEADSLKQVALTVTMLANARIDSLVKHLEQFKLNEQKRQVELDVCWPTFLRP